MKLHTYTGLQIEALSPRPEQIDITDITHALSRQCRYGGMCREHYSVARHSDNVRRAVKAMGGNLETQFYAHMHDSSEAYLVDIPTPIKIELGNYYEIEKNWMGTILAGYDKEWPNWQANVDFELVRDMDYSILVAEMSELFDHAVDFEKSVYSIPRSVISFESNYFSDKFDFRSAHDSLAAELDRTYA
jgi:hypothetical protein